MWKWQSFSYILYRSSKTVHFYWQTTRSLPTYLPILTYTFYMKWKIGVYPRTYFLSYCWSYGVCTGIALVTTTQSFPESCIHPSFVNVLFFTHYIALALANSVKGNCLYVPSSINWVIKFLPVGFKSV